MSARRLFLSILVLVLLSAVPALTYQVLLDIDIDNDPTTLNLLTEDNLAVVKLILAPTEPDELLNMVTFGLGGTCLECDMVHQYGTGHDLIDWIELEWIDAPEFYSGWDHATSLGCPADPGYHLYLWAEPVIDGYFLTEPVFIATFNVWIADPVPPGCTQPPSNLATMFQQGESGVWNFIQIGGTAIGDEDDTWGQVKALYR